MPKASRKRSASAPVEVLSGTSPGLTAILGVAIVALVVGIWAYSPALHGVYLFDDMTLPFAIKGATEIPWTSYLTGVRPLLHIIFWYESNNFTSTFGYHFLNLTLHLVNSILIGLIAFWFLRRLDLDVSLRRWLAMFGGALFLLHPLQTEAVAYIASLSEVLSVLFVLSAYGIYLVQRDRGITIPGALIILVLFVAGVGSKEHAVMLPGLFVATEYFWEKDGVWAGVRRNRAIYILFPLAGAAAAAILWRVLQGATTAGFSVVGMTWYQYLLTQFKVIWIYFRLWVFPFGQNIDHAYPLVKGFDAFSILGGLLLVVSMFGAFRYRRSYPLLAFGFIIFLILIAPTSSFVPIKDTLVERRTYLPGLGLVLMTLDLIRRWKISSEARLGAFSIVLALSAMLTYQRAHAYVSPITMWQDVIAGSPHNSRAHFQLGYAFYERGQCKAAVREYEQVAALEKPDFRLLVDWALALDCDRQAEQAIQKARQAIQVENSAHGWALLGMLYSKANNDEEALKALAQAESRDPNFDATYVYRATLHYNRRRYAEALADYQKALAKNPRNNDAIQGVRLASAALGKRLE